jgi:hypothetical protein
MTGADSAYKPETDGVDFPLTLTDGAKGGH